MIVAFCGHSTYVSNVNDEERLLDNLEKVISGNKVDFYLGGYGAFDAFALKCARKYKERHNNAKIVFVTPYINEWLTARKSTIENVYDEILYPEIEHVPLKLAIIKRNEWIIDRADFVFTYVRTHYGGAYRTLLYTRKRKKPYINLYQGKYELY